MKKVFIGLNNIASQIPDWKKGFQDNGIETFTISESAKTKITDGDFDINLNTPPYNYFPSIRIKKFYKVFPKKLTLRYHLLKKMIRECDVFVFISNSFFRDFSDLELIKKAGKKIVFVCVGDDVRWYHSTQQNFAKYKIPPVEYDENYDKGVQGLLPRIQRLRSIEKYADIILSLPNQSQLALRPYYHFWIHLNTNDFKNKPSQRKIPVVLHAPSSSSVKGTKYVLKAFEQLKKEGIAFKPILLKGKPYKEAIKEYENMDILVGQLLIPSGGKQEREALACGKVVLTSMYYEYEDITPDDCPIIAITPETVYEELKKIILDQSRRQELAAKGRAYVEKYHNPQKIVQRIIQILDNPNAEKPDYYPTFFRDHFIPESKEALKVYEKRNKLVKDSRWYKNYITTGTRAGLNF